MTVRPRLKVTERLTKYSALKTLMKNGKAANQPRSVIIGVTEHTNEGSFAYYEGGDENVQRLISSIVSSDGQASTSTQRHPLQNVGLSFAVEKTQIVNEVRLMTINNFHGCQVNIKCNYQRSLELC